MGGHLCEKILLLIPVMMFLIIMNIQAKDNFPTNTLPTRENVLEDAVIDLLQPQMYSAVEQHYGTTKEIGFMCLRVIEIQKLNHTGSWSFEAKLE